MADLLDRIYRWVWRLPQCKPGYCYCRRTCICILQDEAKRND